MCRTRQSALLRYADVVVFFHGFVCLFIHGSGGGGDFVEAMFEVGSAADGILILLLSWFFVSTCRC